MIHETAIIHPGAELHESVQVGPYSIIGPEVKVGPGTVVESHVVIDGCTTMGKDNAVSPFCRIGGPPQDIKYNGEKTRLVIGDNNIFREYVTINTGTPFGLGVTTVGSNNMILAYSHIGHDCIIGSHIIIVNSAQIAGHVTFEDYVLFGGASQVTQFNTIGESAYIGGGTCVRKSIPPFVSGKGDTFRPQGINSVGLQRRGKSRETIRALKNIYRIFYMKSLKSEEALKTIEKEYGDLPEARHFIDFIKSSKEGVAR